MWTTLCYSNQNLPPSKLWGLRNEPDDQGLAEYCSRPEIFDHFTIQQPGSKIFNILTELKIKIKNETKCTTVKVQAQIAVN